MEDKNVTRLYEVVGKRIAKARKSRKKSQKAMADFLGLSRTSVVNIESGRHRVQLHTLFAVAECLGISPQDLLPSSGTSPSTSIPKEFEDRLGTEERESIRRMVSSSKQEKENDHGKKS